MDLGVIVEENTSEIDDRIKINVRGTIYETKYATLSRYPDTLLGSQVERSKHLDYYRNELFFDRNVNAFECILFYYQSYGILAKPSWISIELFEQECRFFGIDEDRISQLRSREGIAEKLDKTESEEMVGISHTFRGKAWRFFECPESSVGAKIYSIGIFALIMISLTVEFTMTVPEIKMSIELKKKRGDAPHVYLTIEMVFQIIFATDFILRVLLSPRTFRFLISISAIIDILAIFPYFLNIFADLKKHSTNLDFLRVLRTVRVLRMLRLSRHSHTLEAVLSIIKDCAKDFLVLAQCILVACVLFASVGYYAEVHSEETQLTSIPQSMWWAVQTMVCVGYGDVVPVTFPGKLAGSWVAIFGAVTLTIPLVSIGGKYMFSYTSTFSMSMGRDMTQSQAISDPASSRASVSVVKNGVMQDGARKNSIV